MSGSQMDSKTKRH